MFEKVRNVLLQNKLYCWWILQLLILVYFGISQTGEITAVAILLLSIVGLLFAKGNALRTISAFGLCVYSLLLLFAAAISSVAFLFSLSDFDVTNMLYVLILDIMAIADIILSFIQFKKLVQE